MRRLLVVLLCLFISIDVFLAITLFKQDIFSALFKRSVSVTSEVPSFTASISNKKYLDKKLIESGFWKGSPTEKIVIERLNIALTTTPQKNGVIAESEKNPIILFSHSYRYDETTKTVNLTVQANLSAQKNDSSDYLYSYATLLSIFNITHPSSIYTYAEKEKKLIDFMRDFFQNIPNNNFFRTKQNEK